MTKERKQEIIKNLTNIIDEFEPTVEKPKITMFLLVSQYNSQHNNSELIGGKWVRDNIPELADLK